MKRKMRKPTIENLAIKLRDVWIGSEDGGTPLTMADWFDIPASNRRRWRAVARYCLKHFPLVAVRNSEALTIVRCAPVP